MPKMRCLTFSEDSKNSLKKKPKLAKKQELEKPQTEKQELNETSSNEVIKPLDEASEEKHDVKITPDNWLEIFNKLDLSGSSRAFFSNLQDRKSVV